MAPWALIFAPFVWMDVSAVRTDYAREAEDDTHHDVAVGAIAAQASANESGCTLPVPMGPEHFASSVEQAIDGGVQWFTLQCLLQRADQVGGDNPAFAKEKARARKLVRRIWTLEAERHGAFGMTSDQFVRMLQERLSYGVTLSELVYDVHANDAMWELNTLLPEIVDEDQMTGIAGFDYEVVASACRSKAPLDKIRLFANQSLLEMASGCTGGCTKNPMGHHTCGPVPPEQAMCPEGTSCKCREQYNKFAPAIFLGSYIALCLAESQIIPPALVAVMPVNPFALAITSLTSMKYTGCLCMPNICTYSQGQDACGIMPHDGKVNDALPGYPTLPFLGTKCARDPNLPNNGKCYMQRCSANDIEARKLGRIDDAVYNCDKDLWEDYKYVPQKDRFAVYETMVNKSALSIEPDKGKWERFQNWVGGAFSRE